MPPSADDFHWQSRMAALIYSDSVARDGDSAGGGWRCADAIDADTVMMIYRRNLRGGVHNNLAAQFPVTAAYLGRAGFRVLTQALFTKHPPRSPVFNLFAAQLPAFILDFDQYQEQMRGAASALASIDFFTTHVAVVDQSLEMDQRYFELYRSVLQRMADTHADGAVQTGLYRQTDLHPERLSGSDSVGGQIWSRQRGDELVIEYRSV